MSTTVSFPVELTERLKDEALVQICLHGFGEMLEASRRTRGPFAFLRPAKAVDQAAPALSEGVINERIQRLTCLRTSVQHQVRDQLEVYLGAVSPDYRIYRELLNLAARWRNVGEGMQELMIAFARDAHGLRLISSSDQPISPLAFDPLRKVVRSIISVGARANALVQDFARVAEGRLAPKLRLAPLPTLPDQAWLDKIVNLRPRDAAKELRTAEERARDFAAAAPEFFQRSKTEIEAACAAGGQALLERYWQQLREHTRQHHVVGDIDLQSSLQWLERRQQEVENRRQQAATTRSPFARTS